MAFGLGVERIAVFKYGVNDIRDFYKSNLDFLHQFKWVAFDHIISNLAPKPNINDLSDKLFQLGHEHEVEKEIFDMEITPNRGDCLSVIGLQRDLNQFYEFQNNYRIYEGSIKNLILIL